jgi:hypothetical protein
VLTNREVYLIKINTEYALGARLHPNSTEDLVDRITTMQDSINPTVIQMAIKIHSRAAGGLI